MKLFILMAIFLVSCGKSDKKTAILKLEPSESEVNSVIIGPLNWIGVGNISEKKRDVSSTVGLLKIRQTNKRCSAFMISSKIAMTNYHCVRNQWQAQRAIIKFGYDGRGSQAVKVKCDKFLKGNKDLDYALLECNRNIGDEVGIVTFSRRSQIRAGEKIMIAHHNCDHHNDIYCAPYKKLSFGKVLKKKKNIRGAIFHDADTLGGSSGSPIFYYNQEREAYYLVGIHNKGYGDTNENGRGIYNSGILASFIQRDIEGR